ncbi:hypothetical protein [Rhodovulum adriaticum]|uniref:Uncharacterized protein n=1 Tax=Rhodovulum adriaticum TaxID=35804 RepID=A0A4R2NFB8_RHOAD|nr:hypothetical protein [Rhodovulum adriaticum]MBK1637177.1 hypothetical protein [Rhodovulum adriaticum]TCP19957.1 hypothetical protein EV656_1247 [Rhodovulum adriaticum]
MSAPQSTPTAQQPHWRDSLQIGDVLWYAPTYPAGVPVPERLREPRVVVDILETARGRLVFLATADAEKGPVLTEDERKAVADGTPVQIGRDRLARFFEHPLCYTLPDPRAAGMPLPSPVIGRLTDPALDKLKAIRQGLRAIFHILGTGLVRSRKVELSVPDGTGRLAITLPASLPAGRTKARLH